MRTVTLSKLVELQGKTKNIRNICILAHVDHGKTTLADTLIASNGIISKRLAGKLRFMDSRKDEQERGITMKSSAISLYHCSEAKEEYLINLIDSPGHIDFSSEVSTAIRLSDGALILVDVVEGVCPQTTVALRQAWQENIKPTLVLNKMDRLILEVKLTPLDAYLHLTQLLEKVNAVTAELFTAEMLGKEVEKRSDQEERDGGLQELYDWNCGLDEADDSNIYFSPDRGNVVFASAVDGWGFRLEDFANIYSIKVGYSQAVLNRTLWGDFYMNSKSKKIMKGAQEKAKKPLFVHLILENIWTMYDTIAVRKDKSALEKIVANLSLQLAPRDLQQTDFKTILQSVMSTWLPLSKTVLEMVSTQLPSPLDLSEIKIERLLQSQSRSFNELPEESQLKSALEKCSATNEVPTIIFISKMFATDRSSLPDRKPKPLSPEELAARREQVRLKVLQRQTEGFEPTVTHDSTSIATLESRDVASIEPDLAFIAFARVYSGTVRKGQRLYVLGPKYDPGIGMKQFPNGEGIEVGVTLKDLKKGQHVTTVDLGHLYMLMGRELETVDEVPAGCILGIGGLEEHVLKTATISSTLACPAFTDLYFMTEPILRVAVEPRYTTDMAKLRLGLKLLNQADPCVQVFVQETGEHVIVTAGEVHLQRCLDDLRELFAKVEIAASPPIVPFRETIVEPPKMDMVNEAIQTQGAKPDSSDASNRQESSSDPGLVVQQTANKKSTIKIRAVPLPDAVTSVIDEHVDLLKIMKKPDIAIRIGEEKVSVFRTKLGDAFESAGWSRNTVNQIWSFGSHHIGPNVLINCVEHSRVASIWSDHENVKVNSEASAASDFMLAYGSNFVNGFQLATVAGPLAEEPLRGVAFRLEDWTCDHLDNDQLNQPFGPFSGQIMSAAKEACRKAFQAQPQRLMTAMYSSTIQVNAEMLGRLFAVLGKRGGRILHGDLQEGSTIFEVTAQLPVIESFDFANEVRRQTSGMALPQLVFSHWEVLDIDPFWQPTTEEEYLHFGEKADTVNRARRYMNAIRKRKGLQVEEKIVEFGEKQRTLGRNK